MTTSKKVRADYMTEDQKKKMGTLERTHYNCMKAVGVARPGKTAQDKSKRRGSGEPA